MSADNFFEEKITGEYMSKGKVAKKIFLTGANCSQSVVLAFKDETGLSENQLKRLSIAYGGGFGRQRMVCGAVCGMTMILGYLLSDGEEKSFVYKIIQQASEEVKNAVGSLVCKDLLEGKVKVETSPEPEARTSEYYKKRPCTEIVEIVADITEKYLNRYKGN